MTSVDVLPVQAAVVARELARAPTADANGGVRLRRPFPGEPRLDGPGSGDALPDEAARGLVGECARAVDMTPYYADDTLTLYCGDAATALAELPAASVHCVVTSPPYWGLRDYGMPGQLGLEPTPEEYVERMVAVFREVRRVLRADGTFWSNMGDSYAQSGKGGGGPFQAERPGYLPGVRGRPLRAMPGGETADGVLKPKDLIGIPWRLAFALQADGWYLRPDIIWAKPNPDARERDGSADQEPRVHVPARKGALLLLRRGGGARAAPGTARWAPSTALRPPQRSRRPAATAEAGISRLHQPNRPQPPIRLGPSPPNPIPALISLPSRRNWSTCASRWAVRRMASCSTLSLERVQPASSPTASAAGPS